MRVSLCALPLVVSLLCVSTLGSAGTVVHVEDSHFSVEVPTGWSYELDVTSDGDVLDLQIVSPTGFPLCIVESDSWPGIVSSGTLYVEVMEGIDEFEAEGYSITIVSAVQNITVNGVMGNDVTVRMSLLGDTLLMRIVIFASDEWDLGWLLGFAGDDSSFSTYGFSIQSIIDSFSVDSKGGGISSALWIVLSVGLVVVVVIVVAVLMLMKKEPAPVPPPTGPPMPPPQWPQPPPPPGQ